MNYIYPEHLKSKATLFLWELRDLAIIGVLALVAVFALAQTGSFLPLVAAAVFAFLSIQFEVTSILSFLKNATCFLLAKQQHYEWQERTEDILNRKSNAPQGNFWALKLSRSTA